METFYPINPQAWRAWLQQHHDTKKSIWIIYYKKKTKIPSFVWEEAVDQALCFGWIDSTARPINDVSYMQLFTKRNPKSAWSKINKLKIEKLTAAGLMTQAGLDSVETAKTNGSWYLLDDVEELMIPEDLQIAFGNYPGSFEFFSNLCKSLRKSILQWIAMAKRLETRQKRIEQIVEKASRNEKPF